VVLLHGWLDQAASWGRVAQALARDGYRVVAPDHRGHGRSDHDPGGSCYHFPEYVADTDTLISRLSPGAPVALVGHSMGGTIAGLYAGLRPDRLSALVLVDGLGPPAISDEDAVEVYRTFLDHQARHHAGPPGHRPLPDVAAAAARLRRMNPAIDRAWALALAARITRPAPGGVVWTWDRRHRDRSAVGYDAARHRLHLARVRAPTTVILSRQGWYTSALSDLQERLDAIGALQEVIHVDAGHSLHFDAPELLAGHIAQALSGTRASDADSVRL